MQLPCRSGIDDVFLEELLLSESSPRAISPPPFLRSHMDATRKRGGMHAKRNKAPDYPLDAPSTVVRQALFPSGPGSYPSQVAPLRQSKQGHQQLTMHMQDENWARGLSNEHKWREMGWNTSCPAEYLLQANSKDYKQTLAYAEDLQNASCRTEGNKSPTKGYPRSGYFPRSPSFSSTTTTTTTRGVAEVGSAQSEEELALLKYAMLREGLLTKLHDLIKAATPSQSLLQPRVPPKEPSFDISKGTEVLHLLLQLRDTGVMVVESILQWHELRVRLAPMVPLAPFRFENHNYCVKMVSDLDFLSTIKTLGTVLGINPATMKQNPFMMPSPISERDFQGLCEQPWRSLRLFASKGDPVQRVAEAEKYLVWCNSNLQDTFTSPAPMSTSPTRSIHGKTSPTASSLKKREQQQKFTWQKRAEKQLEMLSMPLESPSGSTHVMDSSRIMKRKGVLPSLPKSPPKTLTELMENVNCSGEEEDYGCNDNNHIRLLRIRWSGEEFSASAADFEALGAHNAPPHHMVTLVSASVLILLSPSDRLPKSLSWRSCQKMLRYGGRLIERVQTFDVTSVPVFKWKALVPFLQNEHFQPNFLAQFSNAASSLCAWVYSVLRAAQQQDCEKMGLYTSGGSDAGGDEDRLVLLSELEVDAAASPQAANRCPSLWSENEAMLPPLSKSKSGKRVSIGNAEVLFINENQPVTSSPRDLSRSPSLRNENPVTSSRHKNFTVSLRSGGGSNALLRTSPWTYRGVVYFVSFFLQEDKYPQQEQEEELPRAVQRRLLIKIYEPMSSVESHMDVDTEDLRQDFGDQALAALNSGEYRTLCDLMLGQLDRMMGANERAGPLTPPQPTKKAAQAKKRPKATKQNGLGGKPSVKQENALDLLLQDSESNHGDEEQPEQLQTEEEVSLSTQGQFLGSLEASALKIQCAARQQQARQKVNHVRAEKKPVTVECKEALTGTVEPAAPKEEVAAALEASVLKIQCAARQQQARQKVDRVRGEKQQVVVADNAIAGDLESPSRPGTVMSYTSEHFEDDLEEHENEVR